jgi:hypothetical protein
VALSNSATSWPWRVCPALGWDTRYHLRDTDHRVASRRPLPFNGLPGTATSSAPTTAMRADRDDVGKCNSDSLSSPTLFEISLDRATHATMGKQKKRKNPGVGIDFHKVKHKVGRKLKRAKNDTSVDFKSRAINLPSQSVGAEKSETAVSQRNLTLKVGHSSRAGWQNQKRVSSPVCIAERRSCWPRRPTTATASARTPYTGCRSFWNATPRYVVSLAVAHIEHNAFAGSSCAPTACTNVPQRQCTTLQLLLLPVLMGGRVVLVGQLLCMSTCLPCDCLVGSCCVAMRLLLGSQGGSSTSSTSAHARKQAPHTVLGQGPQSRQ